MKRRDFLKQAGCFVASASVSGLVACGDDDAISEQPRGTFAFPQGVASGDPRPSSVMLWTRVAFADGTLDETLDEMGDDAIELVCEVATDRELKNVVLEERVRASRASDHTVRVLVESLEADTHYFYRFRAGKDESRVGRTYTAPAPNADVPIRFAWVSCQDYAANYYGAYRQMLNDDADAEPAERLRFVLHVGDFIYETRAAGFMQAVDDELVPVMLKNEDGELRAVSEFPSGGGTTSGGVSFARTLEDYRHVYKTYLADADLQDARARWPFVCVWDDHEFSDDCWQTQANYEREGTTDEPSQARRLGASQAWFEFVPAILDDADEQDGVAPEARDFEPVSVEDAPYDDVVRVDEPNNVAAISAITLYRRLRFGRHLDLVLTDARSYRSDHALAEDVTRDNFLIVHPRVALPKDAVLAFDAGQTANDGAPDDVVLGLQNSRKDSPPGTILGEAQKAWWKATMQSSTTTFRVWGNAVPLLRILLDASDVSLVPNDLVLSGDAWDGYPSERNELMAFLKDNGIVNVVSLSGDHHANYAGVVMDDYDAPEPAPVMVDLVTAAISSNSQFVEIASAFDSVRKTFGDAAEPILRVITYDSTPLGGDEKAVVNLNALIRYGSRAANVAADTHDLAQIEAARNPDVNPHLRYADARGIGYGLARVSADELSGTFVRVQRHFEPRGKASPGIVGTATFSVPAVERVEDTVLPEPVLTGKKPFPLA